MASLLPPGFVFSQSALQNYLDCPRRFELLYIKHLKWPAVDSEPVRENEERIQAGQVFHRLAQQSLIGIDLDYLSPLINSPLLATWWQNFQTFLPQFSNRLNFTEITLSAPIGATRLLAKYDLISLHQGRAMIVDWKTSNRRPHNEEMAARIQTRLYLSLLVEAGAHLNDHQPFLPSQVEMIYWYPNHPAEPARFSYTEERFHRDWSALQKLIAEISSTTTFPLTDRTAHCTICRYRSYCDRGIGAMPDDSIESDLADLDFGLDQVQEIAF